MWKAKLLEGGSGEVAVWAGDVRVGVFLGGALRGTDFWGVRWLLVLEGKVGGSGVGERVWGCERLGDGAGLFAGLV